MLCLIQFLLYVNFVKQTIKLKNRKKQSLKFDYTPGIKYGIQNIQQTYHEWFLSVYLIVTAFHGN